MQSQSTNEFGDLKLRAPRVALMILNFNGLQFLKYCLDSVARIRYRNLAIYVVDNDSRDGSREFVNANYPAVKLIAFKRNLGFAEAYNSAVRTVDADYIVLLNNDTVVDSDFIQTLVETAEADSSVGSVGCKVVQRQDTRRYGPVFFTGNGLFIGPLFYGSTIGKSAVYALYNTATECLANSAAAVLYRKPLVDQIGLFDSDFWADWEDHDLGFRISITGHRNLYTPRTTVLHVGAGSFGRVDSRNRVIRTTRNMLFTYVKNYETQNIVLRFFPLLFVILPYRELVVILENELGLILRRDTPRRKQIRATYMASATAYWQFLRGLRHAMKRRQIVQSLRRVRDRDIIQRTSKQMI